MQATPGRGASIRATTSLLRIPKLPKLFHRRRRVTGIIIVRKCKDFSDALILDKTPQHDHPSLQIGLSVDDRLVPGRCCSSMPLRFPNHLTNPESAVARSSSSFISQGRGMNDVSFSAKAALCSRSASVRLASSQPLFLISTRMVAAQWALAVRPARTKRDDWRVDARFRTPARALPSTATLGGISWPSLSKLGFGVSQGRHELCVD